jgi:hypothetical protein
LEELLGEESAAAAKKRGPAPKLQQQMERIQRLPRTQQRFVMQPCSPSRAAEAERHGQDHPRASTYWHDAGPVEQSPSRFCFCGANASSSIASWP